MTVPSAQRVDKMMYRIIESWKAAGSSGIKCCALRDKMAPSSWWYDTTFFIQHDPQDCNRSCGRFSTLKKTLELYMVLGALEGTMYRVCYTQ